MQWHLYDENAATTRRQVVAWALFAMAAGMINAIALQACSRFVSHVTGTVTLIGVDAGKILLMIEYATVLSLFVLGALASAFAVQRRVLAGRRPNYVAPLAVVAIIVGLTAVLGQVGMFSPFGGSVEQPSDFLFLSLLSFALGLQNATVTSATSIAVRTTHMTGPASDLGVHLGTALVSSGGMRRSMLRLAGVRASKVAAFAVGAGLSLPLAADAGYLSLLVPAALIAAAARISFR